jgi:hypothetical protein
MATMLAIHILGASVAVIAVALAARKRSAVHRKSWLVFV